MDEKPLPEIGQPETLERPGLKDVIGLLIWLLIAVGLVVGLFAAAHYLHLPKLGSH